MFETFRTIYRDLRWVAVTGSDFTPIKEHGTRNSAFYSFFAALWYTARYIWFELSGARRRQMQQEERDLMACSLPRRLTVGERLITDSVGLNVKTDQRISNEEADQILKESKRD